MRKIVKMLFGVVAVLTMLMTAGCAGCKGGDVKPVTDDSTAVIQKVTASVEQMAGLDREYVFLHYGKDYRWYETEVEFEHYFDADDTDFSLLFVVNVYQHETQAIKCQHFDGDTAYGDIYALWVGDFDLSNWGLRVTFKGAYERMQAANIIKPHGRYCVLRREVGPVADVNPQYVFGNKQRQVYVDAVTGAVTDKNPAFPPDWSEVEKAAWLADRAGTGCQHRETNN